MQFAKDYVDGANMCMEDRTLFGTAYRTKDLQEGVRDCLALGYREDIIPKILWHNAARLLNVTA